MLPKGVVRKDEDLQAAAVRETQEEVGVEARVVAALGEPERYIYTARGVRVFKEVHYFLMAYVSGDEQTHDAEMEAVRWVPIDEAIETLAIRGREECGAPGQGAARGGPPRLSGG